MEPSVRDLIAIARKGRKREAQQALNALLRMGPRARAALPAMIELTRSKVPALRAGAASCLHAIGHASDAVVRALIRLMRDRYTGVRFFAANAAHNLGAKSPELLRAFLEVVKLSDPETKVLAASALGEYGARASPAKGLLFRRLRDKEWPVRIVSAGALICIDRQDVAVRKALERQRARETEVHMVRRFERLLSRMDARG